MPSQINEELVQEFFALLGDEGLRDVSHWRLPNCDVTFDEAEALDDFNEYLDEAFEATSGAISSIVSRSVG